jgi:hypothetical protein
MLHILFISVCVLCTNSIISMLIYVALESMSSGLSCCVSAQVVP